MTEEAFPKDRGITTRMLGLPTHLFGRRVPKPDLKKTLDVDVPFFLDQIVVDESSMTLERVKPHLDLCRHVVGSSPRLILGSSGLGLDLRHP